MKIKLQQIKGLGRRVRQQMSPEKLEELSDSIKEIGQIVPIKVRKNGEGYTLVYGHRRVMAAKAAGLKEIEAIVEDVPDDKLLTQSLAENVIREDMAAIDIAKALRLILDETGCTQEVLGRRLGWSSGQETVSRYVAMLDPELGLSKHAAQHITHQTVMEAKAGTGGDIKLAAQVLKKAADEELSTRQTRKVAEAVAAAPNALHQRKLLEHEYDPFIHDADRIREQVKRTPGKDPVVLGRQPRADEDWRKSPTVAQMLRYIQQYREDVKRMRDAVKAGKLAPEAKPFMVGKLRGLIQDIETLIALLEE